MLRLVIAAMLGLGTLALSGTAGHAFWKRSHWAACNEAPNDAERARLQCWLFEPVPEFPIGAIEGGAWYRGSGSRGYGRGQQPSPVVKRLG